MNKKIDDAWLNLTDNDKKKALDVYSFLSTGNDFTSRLSYIMSSPDYFSFTCKQILNIELLPTQLLMLQELWKRRFPMLVATRGFGKSYMLSLYSVLRALMLDGRKIIIVGGGFRQSKILFEYMENIWNNSPILRSMCDYNKSGIKKDTDRYSLKINNSIISCLPLGDGCLSSDTYITYKNGFRKINDRISDFIYGNGKFNYSDEFYNNGIKPVKRITTKKGFEYNGTYNHKMKVFRNSNIDWVRTDELQIGDRILIDRSERWHDGNFNCTKDEAYILGSMIGDGCWTNKYSLRFATSDVDHFIPIFNSVFPKKWIKCSEKDKHHFICCSKKINKDWLDFWKMERTYAINKKLPDTILSSSKNNMSACISGLFDTDGTLQISNTKGGTAISIALYSTSLELVKQVQYILLHYGIISNLRSRKRENKNWNIEYSLLLTGKNCKLFAEKIGFRLPRKQNELLRGLSLQICEKSHDDNVSFLKDVMLDICKNNISKNKKISYSIIKRKKNITHKLLDIFLEAYDNINSNVLESLKHLANKDIYYDKIISIENAGNLNTYDMHIPSTHEYCANGFFSHNSKIRGQRAHDIISDEFASIPKDIFETVVAGFGVVSSTPIESVKMAAAKKKAEKEGIILEEEQLSRSGVRIPNQIILSGTAYYDFNHFADYWKKWRKIIKSKGNETKLSEIFPNGIPKGFQWEDYSIMRIPYELVPEGFMDSEMVSRSKATVHSGIYMMEYGASFTKDSHGFFKRSLIQSCVPSVDNQIKDSFSNDILFNTMLIGDKNKKYVFGVDPASEIDNFSIVILELNGDHRRIVHCWTTNRSQHKDIQKMGLSTEKDFYAYCARKIRDLMKRFPCVRIALDAQGGGIAVMEALHDQDKLQEGEMLIWPIIDEGKPQDTDDERGLHILELCQFAKNDWLVEANHGLKKDFEDKVLIFPWFDNSTIGLATADDMLKSRSSDTLEDCVLDIEQLKEELSLIEMSQTPNGRDKWDTPEIILGAGRKKRLRKDRYSSLLMANMSARIIERTKTPEECGFYGGFADSISQTRRQEQKGMYNGPAWFTDSVENIY